MRCPCVLEYVVDNKTHKYIPDFLYKGQLVEIKGDPYINDAQVLVEFNTDKVSPVSEGKTLCMKENNVCVYQYDDIQFALKYIYSKYGRNFLKTCQIRNN